MGLPLIKLQGLDYNRIVPHCSIAAPPSTKLDYLRQDGTVRGV